MRPGNGGWDFVKQGDILQYKEDHLIAIVEIVEDRSTEKQYDFGLHVIAATMRFGDFAVSFSKDFNGAYSGQSQFYANPEYMMLPLGTPWKFVADQAKLDLYNEKHDLAKYFTEAK